MSSGDQGTNCPSNITPLLPPPWSRSSLRLGPSISLPWLGPAQRQAFNDTPGLLNKMVVLSNQGGNGNVASGVHTSASAIRRAIDHASDIATCAGSDGVVTVPWADAGVGGGGHVTAPAVFPTLFMQSGACPISLQNDGASPTPGNIPTPRVIPSWPPASISLALTPYKAGDGNRGISQASLAVTLPDSAVLSGEYIGNCISTSEYGTPSTVLRLGIFYDGSSSNKYKHSIRLEERKAEHRPWTVVASMIIPYVCAEEDAMKMVLRLDYGLVVIETSESVGARIGQFPSSNQGSLNAAACYTSLAQTADPVYNLSLLSTANGAATQTSIALIKAGDSSPQWEAAVSGTPRADQFLDVDNWYWGMRNTIVFAKEQTDSPRLSPGQFIYSNSSGGGLGVSGDANKGYQEVGDQPLNPSETVAVPEPCSRISQAGLSAGKATPLDTAVSPTAISPAYPVALLTLITDLGSKLRQRFANWSCESFVNHLVSGAGRQIRTSLIWGSPTNPNLGLVKRQDSSVITNAFPSLSGKKTPVAASTLDTYLFDNLNKLLATGFYNKWSSDEGDMSVLLGKITSASAPRSDFPDLGSNSAFTGGVSLGWTNARPKVVNASNVFRPPWSWVRLLSGAQPKGSDGSSLTPWSVQPMSAPDVAYSLLETLYSDETNMKSFLSTVDSTTGWTSEQKDLLKFAGRLGVLIQNLQSHLASQSAPVVDLPPYVGDPGLARPSGCVRMGLVYLPNEAPTSKPWKLTIQEKTDSTGWKDLHAPTGTTPTIAFATAPDDQWYTLKLGSKMDVELWKNNSGTPSLVQTEAIPGRDNSVAGITSDVDASNPTSMPAVILQADGALMVYKPLSLFTDAAAPSGSSSAGFWPVITGSGQIPAPATSTDVYPTTMLYTGTPTHDLISSSDYQTSSTSPSIYILPLIDQADGAKDYPPSDPNARKALYDKGSSPTIRVALEGHFDADGKQTRGWNSPPISLVFRTKSGTTWNKVQSAQMDFSVDEAGPIKGVILKDGFIYIYQTDVLVDRQFPAGKDGAIAYNQFYGLPYATRAASGLQLNSSNTPYSLDFIVPGISSPLWSLDKDSTWRLPSAEYILMAGQSLYPGQAMANKFLPPNGILSVGARGMGETCWVRNNGYPKRRLVYGRLDTYQQDVINEIKASQGGSDWTKYASQDLQDVINWPSLPNNSCWAPPSTFPSRGTYLFGLPTRCREVVVVRVDEPGVESARWVLRTRFKINDIWHVGDEYGTGLGFAVGSEGGNETYAYEATGGLSKFTWEGDLSGSTSGLPAGNAKGQQLPRGYGGLDVAFPVSQLVPQPQGDPLPAVSLWIMHPSAQPNSPSFDYKNLYAAYLLVREADMPLPSQSNPAPLPYTAQRSYAVIGGASGYGGIVFPLPRGNPPAVKVPDYPTKATGSVPYDEIKWCIGQGHDVAINGFMVQSDGNFIAYLNPAGSVDPIQYKMGTIPPYTIPGDPLQPPNPCCDRVWLRQPNLGEGKHVAISTPVLSMPVYAPPTTYPGVFMKDYQYAS